MRPSTSGSDHCSIVQRLNTIPRIFDNHVLTGTARSIFRAAFLYLNIRAKVIAVGDMSKVFNWEAD